MKKFSSCPNCRSKLEGNSIFECVFCAKWFCINCREKFDDIRTGILHTYCPGCGEELSYRKGQIRVGYITSQFLRRRREEHIRRNNYGYN